MIFGPFDKTKAMEEGGLEDEHDKCDKHGVNGHPDDSTFIVVILRIIIIMGKPCYHCDRTGEDDDFKSYTCTHKGRMAE